MLRFKWWRVATKHLKLLTREGWLLVPHESTRSTALDVKAVVFRIFGFGLVCSRNCELIVDRLDHFSNLLVTLDFSGPSSLTGPR